MIKKESGLGEATKKSLNLNIARKGGGSSPCPDCFAALLFGMLNLGISLMNVKFGHFIS